jgi:hypothetical protein
MRLRYILKITACTIFLFAAATALANETDEMAVEEILQQIKSAIVAAQQEKTGEPRLRINAVIIDLAVSTPQRIEALVKCQVLNRIVSLGVPASERVSVC